MVIPSSLWVAANSPNHSSATARFWGTQLKRDRRRHEGRMLRIIPRRPVSVPSLTGQGDAAPRTVHRVSTSLRMAHARTTTPNGGCRWSPQDASTRLVKSGSQKQRFEKYGNRLMNRECQGSWHGSRSPGSRIRLYCGSRSSIDRAVASCYKGLAFVSLAVHAHSSGRNVSKICTAATIGTCACKHRIPPPFCAVTGGERICE